MKWPWPHGAWVCGVCDGVRESGGGGWHQCYALFSLPTPSLPACLPAHFFQALKQTTSATDVITLQMCSHSNFCGQCRRKRCKAGQMEKHGFACLNQDRNTRKVRWRLWLLAKEFLLHGTFFFFTSFYKYLRLGSYHSSGNWRANQVCAKRQQEGGATCWGPAMKNGAKMDSHERWQEYSKCDIKTPYMPQSLPSEKFCSSHWMVFSWWFCVFLFLICVCQYKMLRPSLHH